MPVHILVFGGTSPAGIEFCLAALRDGHPLTLYVRNASKLPAEISNSVKTVIGELNNAIALEEAVQCGAKTCVSFLGPVIGGLKKGQRLDRLSEGLTQTPNQPITDGYRLLLPLLEKHAYTRALFVSTASYRAPQDTFSLLYSLMIWSVYLLFFAAYNEINGMTPLITSLPTDKIQWTVFRVPMLKNGDAVPVKAGFVGQGVGMSIERKALAEWVLKEMEERKWVGKCPALSNA